MGVHYIEKRGLRGCWGAGGVTVGVCTKRNAGPRPDHFSLGTLFAEGPRKAWSKTLISLKIPFENISFKQEKHLTSPRRAPGAKTIGNKSHRKDLTLVPGALNSENRSHQQQSRRLRLPSLTNSLSDAYKERRTRDFFFGAGGTKSF